MILDDELTQDMPRVARPNECGHPDRPHYAGGKCRSCYYAAKRKDYDMKYEESSAAKSRMDKYNQSEAGKERKRRWKNKRDRLAKALTVGVDGLAPAEVLKLLQAVEAQCGAATPLEARQIVEDYCKLHSLGWKEFSDRFYAKELTDLSDCKRGDG